MQARGGGDGHDPGDPVFGGEGGEIFVRNPKRFPSGDQILLDTHQDDRDIVSMLVDDFDPLTEFRKCGGPRGVEHQEAAGTPETKRRHDCSEPFLILKVPYLERAPPIFSDTCGNRELDAYYYSGALTK